MSKSAAAQAGQKVTKKDSKRGSMGSFSGSLNKAKAGSSAALKRPSVTSGRRMKIMKKAKALHPLELLFGEVLTKSGGVKTNPKTLAVDEGVLGIYFSANWCPPCHTFTPLLMLLYDEMKKKGQKFEVVFVSFDMQEQAFEQYSSKMPWWSMDFSDSDKREEVACKFSIRGIPVLLFLDPKTLDVIAKNGREIVMADPRGKYFPWKSLPDLETLKSRYTPIPSLREEVDKEEERKAEEERGEERAETGEEEDGERGGGKEQKEESDDVEQQADEQAASSDETAGEVPPVTDDQAQDGRDAVEPTQKAKEEGPKDPLLESEEPGASPAAGAMNPHHSSKTQNNSNNSKQVHSNS
ncbi:uncharacterized protein LOC101850119 [Aplysia californica]|uniref:Uncharacterized protein LOC101850119 n=1 Tax=Aplysia californica TaxID=6500 RepID=A0ABM0K6N0_APLCA|nr:uncharacterized protein LOC101850119 [Aplysia californica]